MEIFIIYKTSASATGTFSETINIAGQSKTLSAPINSAPAEAEDLSGEGVGLGPTSLRKF